MNKWAFNVKFDRVDPEGTIEFKLEIGIWWCLILASLWALTLYGVWHLFKK